jgi:hypothetical protein
VIEDDLDSSLDLCSQLCSQGHDDVLEDEVNTVGDTSR